MERAEVSRRAPGRGRLIDGSGRWGHDSSGGGTRKVGVGQVRHHPVKHSFWAEESQTMVLVALALPLFFAVIALVIDGSSLMAQRRTIQNAADASSLAAAQELTVGTACVSPCTPVKLK